MSSLPGYSELDEGTSLDLFEKIRVQPSVADWIYSEMVFSAPDHSLVMDVDWFESHGSIGVYALIARRLFICEETTEGKFHQDLLQALAVLPAVSCFLQSLDSVMEVVTSFAEQEGLEMNLWYLNQASVRARGRHPDGWLFTIECSYVEQGVWMFHGAITHDIYLNFTRSRQSWSTNSIYVTSPVLRTLPMALMEIVLQKKRNDRPRVDYWRINENDRWIYSNYLESLPVLKRFDSVDNTTHT